MNTKKNVRSELVCLVMLVAIIISVMSGGTIGAKAANISYRNENNYVVNVSSSADWRSGEYDNRGNNIENKRRIRLAQSQTYQDSIVKININSEDFRLKIYEYDGSQLVQILDCGNGTLLNYTGKTRTLEAVLYRTYSEKSLSAGQWGRLFTSGLSIEFEVQQTANKLFNVSNTEIYQQKDFSSMSCYESGDFSTTNGSKIENKRRIRINEYLPINNESLTFTANDNNYKLMIYEYDENTTFLKACTIGNGEKFTPLVATRKIGITLYRTFSEKSLSMGQWGRLFGDGLKVDIGLNNKNLYIQTQAKAPTATPIPTKAPTATPIPTKAPTPTPITKATDEKSVREMLMNMLETGEKEYRDISAVDLAFYELNNIWVDIIENDGYVAFQTHAAPILQVTWKSNNRVATVGIRDLDEVYGKAFVQRYDRVKRTISEVAEATRNMSTLEKVLYVNEYVVTRTTYKNETVVAHYAGGSLGENEAVCEGYANACVLLLRAMNINAELVSSVTMNHAWVYVQIDGEWYHCDPTWDDTGKNINENNYKHSNFLRNDQEYLQMSARHYDWKFNRSVKETLTSTSNRFSNWFLHDVRGRILYHEGLWYYTDPASGNIVASKLDKSNYRVILDINGSGYLEKIENNILQYVENGMRKSITI